MCCECTLHLFDEHIFTHTHTRKHTHTNWKVSCHTYEWVRHERTILWICKVRACVYARVRAYVWMIVWLYLHARACTHTHAHTHLHRHTHTHTQMHNFSLSISLSLSLSLSLSHTSFTGTRIPCYISLSTINWASGNGNLFGTNRTKKWVRNWKSEERVSTVWISTPVPHVSVYVTCLIHMSRTTHFYSTYNLFIRDT